MGREYVFAELDLRLLTAGELKIITGDTVSAVEKEGRPTLLKDVTYIAGSHGWQTAKNVYSAVLRKFELGTLHWDSDFYAIKQVVLLKPTATNTVTKFGAKKPRGSVSPNAWYCHAFQSKSCTKRLLMMMFCRARWSYQLSIFAQCVMLRIRKRPCTPKLNLFALIILTDHPARHQILMSVLMWTPLFALLYLIFLPLLIFCPMFCLTPLLSQSPVLSILHR